ncbi:gp100 [Bacillus phage G]|uniref:Gp100 n=1 Tax=Bacillus phage G TaxID=2884420 RepID=G3MBG2_9CAUD|nr:gp100 [Bacillus phage G]AEO93362.1 gp100 [Bacillus phage G]
MLQEEVIDMIMEEISEFVENYIIMSSLMQDALYTEVDPGKSIRFLTRSERYGSIYSEVRHQIIKRGRTRIAFSFRFLKEEADYAMELVHLLESYVEYSFGNYSNHYSCNFVLDVGSKKNGIELFEKVSFLK